MNHSALNEPLPASQGSATSASATAASAGTLRRAAWWSASLVLLLTAGAAARVLSNAQRSSELTEASSAGVIRQVLTVRAKPAAGLRNLTLPGTLRGRQEAVVYARTGGYLKRWTKDIGDTVRRGELLAEIDAPEIDQELSQSRAVRDQVQARAQLAQSSLARWESMLAKEATSAQEVDERRAARAQAVADLAAAEANIKRLEALVALRRVVAPFDGVVVRRNAEVGALVSATNARELYALAEIDTLRIDLAVPQAYAASIQPAQAVQVRWPERPGLLVEGRISRAAPGIDAATRTRQVVIDLPNPDRKLLPGSYVDVQWQGSSPRAAAGAASGEAPRVLTVPQGTVQFRQEGPRVALVQNDHIVLRNLTLGRDLGRDIEVLSGLSPKDDIVLNPPDSITDGEQVHAQAAPVDKPAAEPPKKAASSPAGGGA